MFVVFTSFFFSNRLRSFWKLYYKNAIVLFLSLYTANGWIWIKMHHCLYSVYMHFIVYICKMIYIWAPTLCHRLFKLPLISSSRAKYETKQKKESWKVYKQQASWIFFFPSKSLHNLSSHKFLYLNCGRKQLFQMQNNFSLTAFWIISIQHITV